MSTGHTHGMDIETDEKLEHREWAVQRVAWTLLVLLMIAIALGLFGRGGALSDATVAAPGGGYHMDYQRFVRSHAPDVLRVRAATPGEQFAIRLDRGYLHDIALQQVHPAPARVVADAGGTTFHFHTQAGGSIEANFHYAPEKIGPLRGTLAVGGGAPQYFSQFVYP
ncbi:MAG TPA: hypothetical protein VIT92_07340 [Burkholderiaceae bacterium]